LITGASQGLGAAIARAYVQAGASVMLCARGPELLEKTRLELAGLAQPGQIVRAVAADVADGAAVEQVVHATLQIFPRLDILVNNAGIYGPKGYAEETDWKEWVRTIEINLYGSVLMCRALLPHFKGQKYGKIIQLSGGGATAPKPRLSAYATSKAAIVRFAETLAEEVRGFGIDVNSIAPGSINSRMLDEVLAAGPELVGPAFYEQSLKQKARGGDSPTICAALTVFLGSAASDGLSAKLLSALWDPWATLPQRLAELNKSDIYTLRRIVPEDRGQNWS
jgi:NAD(P)-dependent dehydrogenase (short-subunit alcohol dehydrogenase family)